jgi:hypothetical protein
MNKKHLLAFSATVYIIINVGQELDSSQQKRWPSITAIVLTFENEYLFRLYEIKNEKLTKNTKKNYNNNFGRSE